MRKTHHHQDREGSTVAVPDLSRRIKKRYESLDANELNNIENATRECGVMNNFMLTQLATPVKRTHSLQNAPYPGDLGKRGNLNVSIAIL